MALVRSFSSCASPALSAASSSSSSSSCPLSTSSSPSSHTAEVATDTSTRCRYKTGRCGNARVVKPNGSLLLLCEFHRDQQNRTKKRSDMKYRHHRAKKRQLEKHSPRLHTAPGSSCSSFGLRHAASQLAITITQSPSQPRSFTPTVASQPLLSSRVAFVRPSLLCEQQQLLSPIVSTPTMLSSTTDRSGRSLLHTPGAVLARRQHTSSAALQKTALFSRISPGKLRLGHQGAPTASTRFALSSRRDIVAMASPAAGKAACATTPLSPMVFPPCLSPLQHNSPWARAWQPEDVRLLEYFIL